VKNICSKNSIITTLICVHINNVLFQLSHMICVTENKDNFSHNIHKFITYLSIEIMPLNWPPTMRPAATDLATITSHKNYLNLCGTHLLHGLERIVLCQTLQLAWYPHVRLTPPWNVDEKDLNLILGANQNLWKRIMFLCSTIHYIISHIQIYGTKDRNDTFHKLWMRLALQAFSRIILCGWP